MARAAAAGYLCLGTALIAIHLAVGGSTRIYEIVGLTSVCAVLAGIYLWRPRKLGAWLCIAAAQTFFWLGDLIYQQGHSAFPGPADAFYLASYGAFLTGLLMLMGREFPWGDWEGHLDALLITICLGFAGWIFLLGRSMEVTWSVGGAVSVAYPLLDLAAIGLLIRIGILPGRRPPAYWLMLACCLPLMIADGSYVIPSLAAGYQLGSWLDAFWLGSYVLLGAAALHPTMRRLEEYDPEARRHSTLRGVLAGFLGLVVVRAADRYQGLIRHHTDGGLSVAVGIVLALLVLIRIALLVRELDLARKRAEQSERKFRMVFERSPIGISIGREGIMSETNPALHGMLGYTAEEFAHMHYTQVTHPDELDLKEQHELDEGVRDHFSIDKKYVRKDGNPVEAHIHVVLDASDGLGISLIEDVTERLELEAQLRQSQKMDAIGKLAGGIAHDFNNLMTAVLGYSELLLARLPASDPNREKVEGIKDAALRASDLTRQLLAFGRRQMLQVSDVDLRQVVSRSENLLRRLIGEDVKLDTSLGGEPVIVRADPTQLDQVVMNLAVNAREAMPGGGTLTIVVTREGEEAVLAVGDTGVGIDEATRERIFEPFFTTKPVGEGAGLGLSTVDGIVAQSGGTVAVTSEPGRGTVFTIRLPVVSTAAKVAID